MGPVRVATAMETGVLPVWRSYKKKVNIMPIILRETERDRQTERDGQRERERERETDTHTHTHTHTHTCPPGMAKVIRLN